MPSELVQRQKKDILRDISSFGSLVFYLFLLAIALVLKKGDLFARMVAGLILIYFITLILRTVYFKNRPVKFSYSSYIEKLDASSFPSLHASRTAFLGSELSKYFGNPIFTAIMVVLILAIACTRVYLRKHDFIDVSAGIVLGILVYFGVNFLL